MLDSRRVFAVGAALSFAACAADPDAGGGATPIVGGRAIAIEEAPWQVSLHDDFGHFCGGSILSPDWVLTAAHCVEFAAEMAVVAGVTRQSDAASGQIRRVAEVVSFPGFTSPLVGKDIALVRLAEPLVLDGKVTRAIALVDDAAVRAGLTDPGVEAMVSGWGMLSSFGFFGPDELHGVEVPLMSNEEAQAAYAGETITDDQLAAGFPEGGKDACQGDSGGPLVVPSADGADVLLAGVVSWGFGCAAPNAPGMYARVSSFHRWIGDEMAGGGGGGEGLLIINEVLADPPAGYDMNGDGVADPRQDEFIELVNGGDATLDLSGATIADAVGIRGQLPAGTVLAPGAALLVFGGGAPSGLPVAAFTMPLSLNNDGDTITVSAADGTVLATASYGAEGGRDQSLVRRVEGTASPLVPHREVSDAAASPGTRADGSPF
jgi:hypothetical protein